MMSGCNQNGFNTNSENKAHIDLYVGCRSVSVITKFISDEIFAGIYENINGSCPDSNSKYLITMLCLSILCNTVECQIVYLPK